MKAKKTFIKQEEQRLKRQWKNIILNFISAFLGLFVIALFYKNIFLTSLLLGVIFIIMLIKWKSWLTFAIFIAGAILGPAFEIIAISYNAWNYTLPNVFNIIPFWLFLAWGGAAAFFYQLSREIKSLGVRK